MVLSRNLSLLISLSVLIFCCKNTNTERNGKLNKFDTNRVFINGKSDDTEALKYFNLLAFDNFYGGNLESLKQEIRKDSLLLSINDLKEAQLMEVMAFGKSGFYNFKIFVTPGDSINFELSEGKWKFFGKKSAHYNFFNQKEMVNIRWPKYKGIIMDYKKECQAVYTKKERILNKYLVENQNVSKEFIAAVKSELKFEYLYNLIAPRDIRTEIEGIYVNNMEGIYSSINDEFNSVEKGLFDIRSYFNDIKIQDFDKPELISNDYFKRSLVEYIRHYFIGLEYLNYSKETFMAEKAFIENNLEGEIKYYSIGRLITDYHKRGFGNSRENIELMKNVIGEYRGKSSNPSYTKILDSINKSLESFDLRVPIEILDERLINLNGDDLSVKDVFNHTKGSIKVFTFWASWCGPCIKEIRKTKKFRNKLGFKDNVNFIYLSVDKNKNKWFKKSQELQKEISSEHQYLLSDTQNSALIRFLSVNIIPRYTIIDNRGRIILEDAPRPSDSLNFKKIIDNLNSMNLNIN